MMARGFVSDLDECLAALKRGETLEDCLARYPKRAEELRTHLLLAQRLSQTPQYAPRPSVQSTGWQQFRARAEDMRLGRKPPISINIDWVRPLAIAAVLVAAVLAAGGGTVYASQSALPDSPLYRVKLASEEVQLSLTFDDTRKAERLLDQSSARADEIMEMLRSGKPIPGNVLSALRSRNARAVRILEDDPEQRALLARANEQSAAQEDLLLAVWGDLAESARDDYAEAVATLHNAQLRTSDASGAVTPEDLAAGVIRITGSAEPVAEGVWLFGGVEVEVRLDSGTLGDVQLEQGQTVSVIAARGEDGRLLALNLAATGGQEPEQQYVVSGALEQVTDGEVVIAGQEIAITERTLLKLQLLQGQQVEIKVEDVDGEAVASSVEGATSDPEEAAPALLAYEGIIEDEVSTEEITNEWVVGGQRFLVTPSTEIDAQAGALAKDARIRVEAAVEGDDMVAKRVIVLSSDAEEDVIRVEGVFEEEGDDEGSWIVSGVAVEAPAEVDTPEVGSLVTLEGRREGDLLVADTLLAALDPSNGGLTQLRGLIGGVEDDGTLQVGFARVQMGAETVISGQPQVGSRVFIWGTRDDEGSLRAIYINVLDSEPLVPETGSQTED